MCRPCLRFPDAARADRDVPAGDGRSGQTFPPSWSASPNQDRKQNNMMIMLIFLLYKRVRNKNAYLKKHVPDRLSQWHNAVAKPPHTPCRARKP